MLISPVFVKTYITEIIYFYDKSKFTVNYLTPKSKVFFCFVFNTKGSTYLCWNSTCYMFNLIWNLFKIFSVKNKDWVWSFIYIFIAWDKMCFFKLHTRVKTGIFSKQFQSKSNKQSNFKKVNTWTKWRSSHRGDF